VRIAGILSAGTALLLWGAPACSAEAPVCPKTGGVELGQKRPEAFEMMAHEVTADQVFHHAPKDRGYTVDVTFSSAKPDAAIVALHYVFKPAQGLLDGILARYGEPTVVAKEPGAALWNIAACGVQLRYKMQEVPGVTPPQPLQEEMWLDPIPSSKAAPKATPKAKAKSKSKPKAG